MESPQGKNSCPCWLKANFNPWCRFRRVLFGGKPLTPANLLSFAHGGVDHKTQFEPRRQPHPATRAMATHRKPRRPLFFLARNRGLSATPTSDPNADSRAKSEGAAVHYNTDCPGHRFGVGANAIDLRGTMPRSSCQDAINLSLTHRPRNSDCRRTRTGIDAFRRRGTRTRAWLRRRRFGIWLLLSVPQFP